MEASLLSKTLSTTITPFLFHRLRHSTSLFPLSSAAAARRLSRAYRLPDSPLSPSIGFCGHRALRCASRQDVPFPVPGGGDGGKSPGAGGSGGGGGGDGEDARGTVDSAAGDTAVSSEVIILDVGGMSCGGCAASVKRILESQPQVSTASVNLTTETAVIWPKSEAKTVPNWQKELGDALAKHLTSCGFKSNLRGEGVNGDLVS
ncbi:hypothetical protein MLD38_026744 [Melastoma candidum]|uniref:Uncharacterized protein n=1 Tax=Melastoma candidum TaxID=119954 RepID=A0ACB9P1E8_9MYRT|nr:hypothetical protein MLD38_026744 [Melastoma candidum]